MKEIIVHPFKPIINEESEILVLGSFPSVVSRSNDFYYGNKKNRFWRLLDLIYGTNLDLLSNMEKKNKLLEIHIAIYDVVYSCSIVGSSDSSIEDVIYSDINSLIKNTKIKKIYCNGKTAYNLFIKGNSNLKAMAVYLPSTSPANAAFSIDKLYSEWKIIRE